MNNFLCISRCQLIVFSGLFMHLYTGIHCDRERIYLIYIQEFTTVALNPSEHPRFQVSHQMAQKWVNWV